ncbi:MAG TPA: HAD family hydrolase [Polyangiales bacterium]|nr:HAD family hydrolase [Polyangiales bacterium]
MKKLLLFDIDGTLMVGYGAGTRAMLRAGRALFGERFDLEGVMIGGGMDPVIFAQAMARLGVADVSAHHDGFRDLYLQELSHELTNAAKRPHVLPGVTQLLQQLALRDDVVIGLVTGNYRAAVPIKFAAVGLQLETFVIGAFGDCGPTRPDLVRLALERAAAHAGFAFDPRQTFVIGDTPRDVDCALHHGCVCLAVATGGHTAEELRSAGAQHVTSDLSDANVLLSLLM